MSRPFPFPRFVALVVVAGVFLLTAHGEDPTDVVRGKQVAEMEKQIADLQKKIADLKNPPAKKALTFADTAIWRNITAAALSPDGAWFVHRVGAQEGESEVIVKATKGDKEYKFPAGAAFGQTAFSADSQWLAFTVVPANRPSATPPPMSAARRPSPKVVLVKLATGDKSEFEGVRSFAFNGDAATHLAMRKAPSEASAGPTSPIPGPPFPGLLTGGIPIGPTGTDLIVRELASGTELNLGNVADFAFNKSGVWLAMTIDAAGQLGNGVHLRDMKTGVLFPVDTGKATYQSLSWNEAGDAIALLKGVEDKSVEGKVYSVLGFTEIGPATKKVVYDPKADATFPKGFGITANRSPAWTDDLGGLMFGISEQKKSEEPKKEEPKKDAPPAVAPTPRPAVAGKPDLVLWHWQDERLQSEQQVQAGSDKLANFLCVYRVKEKKLIRLADDTVKSVSPAAKHQYAIGRDTKPYQLMSTLDGKRFEDIYVINMETGERKKALTKARWVASTSTDGTHLLYYEDGHYFTLELATLKTFNVSANAGTSFIDTEDDHPVDKPPTRPVGWSADGKFVLISDHWDVWQLAVHGDTPAVNLTVDGKTKAIRYRGPLTLDFDEKGIDLTKPRIVALYGEWTKKAGFGRVEPGKPGATPLLWDDASFRSLIKAKNADTFAYARETNQDAPELYLTDANLKDGKKVTNTNPQQANYLWSSGAKLIDYVGINNQKLQAALFLPANYEPGKKYPTIVYIYEKLSEGLHGYSPPGTGGFNKAIYTSNGYAVLMPDIKYQINDPGISAVKCILPALDAAIASGVVDGDKVGLQGHSWGGYQTAFLVTQTDRFKAAIAGAPLTNLVSMYSLIYWNAGITNQMIFESSQGRFTGGYFDLQDAYIRNSPVFHAKNVKTPLVILHNDKDGAVDFTQGVEYFNTLRRLQKPVVMLQYKGENHGLAKPDNRKDYSVRMKEFFDHHLTGKPAPDWWKEGVPHLKMDEYLKGRKD